MDNTLKNKSYEWLLNAIESSNNPFHVDCCKKLIELFVIKFGDTQAETELLTALQKKQDTINFI